MLFTHSDSTFSLQNENKCENETSTNNKTIYDAQASELKINNFSVVLFLNFDWLQPRYVCAHTLKAVKRRTLCTVYIHARTHAQLDRQCRAVLSSMNACVLDWPTD